MATHPPGPHRLQKGEGNALREVDCLTRVTQPASGSPEIPNPKSEGGERGASRSGQQDPAQPDRKAQAPAPPTGSPQSPTHILLRACPPPLMRRTGAASEPGPPHTPHSRPRAPRTARCSPEERQPCTAARQAPRAADSLLRGGTSAPHPGPPPVRPASPPPGSPSSQLPAPSQRPPGPWAPPPVSAPQARGRQECVE